MSIKDVLINKSENEIAKEKLQDLKKYLNVNITINDDKLLEKYKDDREVMKILVSIRGDLILRTDKYLNDKEMVILAVKENGSVLEKVSKALKNDREVVLTAVKERGCSLQYASKKLQNDKEVVLAAVKQNGYALQFASDNMKKDKEVVEIAADFTPEAILYCKLNDHEVLDIVLNLSKKYPENTYEIRKKYSIYMGNRIDEISKHSIMIKTIQRTATKK